MRQILLSQILGFTQTAASFLIQPYPAMDKEKTTHSRPLQAVSLLCAGGCSATGFVAPLHDFWGELHEQMITGGQVLLRYLSLALL